VTYLAVSLSAVLIALGAAAAQQPTEIVRAAVQPIGESPAAGVPNSQGDPDDRRDPFRPFTLDLRPDTSEEEILTPLQRYELAQLRVAGVIMDLDPPRAMLQDSSGMGFIVSPGTRIGRRRGVVKSIEPRRVIVEEKSMDFYGQEQATEVVLEMPEDEQPHSASRE
jgi:hypothetical protein